MPNDCWNEIVITGDTYYIKKFLDTEFQDVPEWALEIKIKKELYNFAYGRDGCPIFLG
jgi:hypothetical protein